MKNIWKFTNGGHIDNIIQNFILGFNTNTMLYSQQAVIEIFEQQTGKEKLSHHDLHFILACGKTHSNVWCPLIWTALKLAKIQDIHESWISNNPIIVKYAENLIKEREFDTNWYDFAQNVLNGNCENDVRNITNMESDFSNIVEKICKSL